MTAKMSNIPPVKTSGPYGRNRNRDRMALGACARRLASGRRGDHRGAGHRGEPPAQRGLVPSPGAVHPASAYELAREVPLIAASELLRDLAEVREAGVQLRELLLGH